MKEERIQKLSEMSAPDEANQTAMFEMDAIESFLHSENTNDEEQLNGFAVTSLSLRLPLAFAYAVAIEKTAIAVLKKHGYLIPTAHQIAMLMLFGKIASN